MAGTNTQKRCIIPLHYVALTITTKCLLSLNPLKINLKQPVSTNSAAGPSVH